MTTHRECVTVSVRFRRANDNRITARKQKLYTQKDTRTFM